MHRMMYSSCLSVRSSTALLSIASGQIRPAYRSFTSPGLLELEDDNVHHLAVVLAAQSTKIVHYLVRRPVDYGTKVTAGCRKRFAVSAQASGSATLIGLFMRLRASAPSCHMDPGMTADAHAPRGQHGGSTGAETGVREA